MLNDLFRAMHTWDDLVDKDKPVSEADINGAFVALMVHVPANPFYLIYPSREHLAPALRTLMDFVAERLPFA